MTALKAEAKKLKLLQTHFPHHPHIAGLLDFAEAAKWYHKSAHFFSCKN
jgi:hypothetical protein